jgi:hypothetical protein
LHSNNINPLKVFLAIAVMISIQGHCTQASPHTNYEGSCTLSVAGIGTRESVYNIFGGSKFVNVALVSKLFNPENACLANDRLRE